MVFYICQLCQVKHSIGRRGMGHPTYAKCDYCGARGACVETGIRPVNIHLLRNGWSLGDYIERYDTPPSLDEWESGLWKPS